MPVQVLFGLVGFNFLFCESCVITVDKCLKNGASLKTCNFNPNNQWKLRSLNAKDQRKLNIAEAGRTTQRYVMK